MTILGKLLVFLILVLSLVWNGLALNAYVTRTNWKAEATRTSKSAQDSAESATKMKSLYDANQEASEDAKRVQREEIARLYEQNKILADNQTELIKKFNEQFLGTAAANLEAKKLQQNVDKLAQENKIQRDQLDKIIKDLDDKTKSEEAAKVTSQQSLLAASSEKQRAERLAERVRELSDQLEASRRPGGGGSGGLGQGGPVAPAPEGFRGTATSIDLPMKAGGDIYVTFKPGGDVGLRAGAELKISREKPAKYVGKIVVLVVDTKEAVGKFIPPAGVRALGPDDYPKVNDVITDK